MMKMTTTRVEVLCELIPDTLMELETMVAIAMSSVPREYREKVELQQQGECTVNLLAYYDRPETEEERLNREESHRLWVAQNEADERRKYERLKAKFG